MVILPKLNIFVENNHRESKTYITAIWHKLPYNKTILFRGPHFNLSKQLSKCVEKFSYGALMIGGFKINVHAKKSVRPNLHYMSNTTSLTWPVFKLLSEQRKMTVFLLCHISLPTIILVAQQIVTVHNERWPYFESFPCSLSPIFYPIMFYGMFEYSRMLLFWYVCSICHIRGTFGGRVSLVKLEIW